MLRRGRVVALALVLGAIDAFVALVGALLVGGGVRGLAGILVTGIGFVSGVLTAVLAVVAMRATQDRDPDDAVAVTVGTLAGSLFIAVFGFLALRGLGLLGAVLAAAALALVAHLVLRRGLPATLG